MGKRKSSSKPQGPKRREGLPTVFTCLFCNHEKSVEVKLDKKAGCGTLDCKTCGQKFQCQINYLSSAIDVYSEWVDAADAVADEAKQKASRARPGGNPSNRRAGESSQRIDEDEEEGGGYEGDDIIADDEEYE